MKIASGCNYEKRQRVHPEVRRHYRLESGDRARDERMSRNETEVNVHPLQEELDALAAVA